MATKFKGIATVFAFFIFTSFFSTSVSAFEGPLQVKNQFPLFIYINTPYLESATIEDSLSLSLSHSSIYTVRSSKEWSIGLDMEITELNLRLKKNIKDFLEIGVDIPIVCLNSGFMDGFLNSYHDIFGFPDYGRSNRPDNEFLYEIRKSGVLIIKGRNGKIGIGDIRISLKKPLLYSNPVISIQGEIELPTGDAGSGYGSGNIDAGISLLSEINLSKKIKTFLNIGAVSPGNLKGYKTIKLREFIYCGAGIETHILRNLSILGQLFIQGSPFPKTDISAIDRTAMLFSLGGRYYTGKNSFEISLTEDPNTSGAPDFTLNFSFKRRF